MPWPTPAQRTLPARLAAGLALATAIGGTQAAAVWQQNDDLHSILGGAYTYSTNGNTAVVTYLNQTATNTGPSARHMGMYFGWSWLGTTAGQQIALPWSNADGAFEAAPVALTIERPGFAAQTLKIGDVQGDTWIGVPWAPGAEPKIATAADWVVPMFDFGWIDAGASMSYDIQFSFAFASADDLAHFDSFQSYAQGISTVPEPTTLWLLGLGALCLLLARKPSGLHERHRPLGEGRDGEARVDAHIGG